MGDAEPPILLGPAGGSEWSRLLLKLWDSLQGSQAQLHEVGRRAEECRGGTVHSPAADAQGHLLRGASDLAGVMVSRQGTPSSAGTQPGVLPTRVLAISSRPAQHAAEVHPVSTMTAGRATGGRLSQHAPEGPSVRAARPARPVGTVLAPVGAEGGSHVGFPGGYWGTPHGAGGPPQGTAGAPRLRMPPVGWHGFGQVQRGLAGLWVGAADFPGISPPAHTSTGRLGPRWLEPLLVPMRDGGLRAGLWGPMMGQSVRCRVAASHCPLQGLGVGPGASGVHEWWYSSVACTQTRRAQRLQACGCNTRPWALPGSNTRYASYHEQGLWSTWGHPG